MRNFAQSVFSIKNEGRHKVIIFCGLKFKLRLDPDRMLAKETQKAIDIQNCYDLSELKTSKKLIIFFALETNRMCGGLMSIFSLCKYSREICKDSCVLMCTLPGNYTHSENNNFINDELIYRWEQIVNNLKNKEEVILQVSEYSFEYFYKILSEKDISLFKTIPNLQINILNQNIDNMNTMVAPEKIEELKVLLTPNITQTTAHDKYTTQEVCNKWNIPTHLFSVYFDMSHYTPVDFSDKEKLILFSLDWPNGDFKLRDKILQKLVEELPDYKLRLIEGLSFTDCMELTAKSLFTISFGEGYDGYFIHPLFVDSLGLTAYNEQFFPDDFWLEYRNVYSDYNEMCQKIVGDIKFLSNNREKYNELVKTQMAQHNKLYSFEGYMDNLRRFYEKKYDFYPNKYELNESINRGHIKEKKMSKILKNIFSVKNEDCHKVVRALGIKISLKNKINIIQQSMDNFQESLNAVQASIDAIQHNVNTVQSSIDAVQHNVNAVQSSVDAIQHNVNAVHVNINERADQMFWYFKTIHKHIDIVQRDILVALNFIPKHKISLKSSNKLAVDSNDHKFPFGTMQDNTRCPRFIRKCESLFPIERSLKFLDLGCSGGGLVLDACLKGHVGIGLEGSDYSLLNQRAEWRLLKNNLFLCDIIKDFELHDEETQNTAQFDIISAWEVVEHLSENDLTKFFENVKNHLKDDGYFIASVSLVDSFFPGTDVNLHQTVKPREWWYKKIDEVGFKSHTDIFVLDDFARGSGNNSICWGDPELHEIEESFHLVLTKK